MEHKILAHVRMYFYWEIQSVISQENLKEVTKVKFYYCLLSQYMTHFDTL